MTITKLGINGCFLLEHKVFPDNRGLFSEWFKADELSNIVPDFSVQQANYSNSKKGVLRGIHYSLAPIGQSKLVTCAQGVITDVLIDLRVGSPTYLNVEYVKLAGDSGNVVFIATGVGHGFVVESETASVVYLTSSAYAPDFEKSICPTDPALRIQWPMPSGTSAVLSPADANAPSLAAAKDSGDLPKY
jgi:dTDP-4-dehydrorhamnose 3,5-epimerase